MMKSNKMEQGSGRGAWSNSHQRQPRRRVSVALAVIVVVMGIHWIAGRGQQAAAQAVPLRTLSPLAMGGDFDGDGKTDLALVGGSGWQMNPLPLAFSHGDGTFGVFTADSGAFNGWAQASGVHVVSGDFNGDGKTDLALVGGSGWSTIPMAFSRGDSTFRITNAVQSDFAGWAQVPGIQVVSGDFNGDGKTDLALVPGPNTPGWYTLPVALSNGDGTFRVTNTTGVGVFTSSWAQTSGVQVVSGDFNGDGKTDIALTGGSGWSTLPVALSQGDGTFAITNANQWDFASWAQASGVRVISGDFNGDGKTDLALVPGPNTPWWYTLPVAMSNGDGTFRVTNTTGVGVFTSSWAQTSGVQVVSGDFNGDGKTDLALTGGSGWYTIPVALSQGDGTFAITNAVQGDFAGWVQEPGVQVISGDFNHDGKTDLALTGGSGWYTVPVAFSTGNGAFTVTNQPIKDFALLATNQALPSGGVYSWEYCLNGKNGKGSSLGINFHDCPDLSASSGPDYLNGTPTLPNHVRQVALGRISVGPGAIKVSNGTLPVFGGSNPAFAAALLAGGTVVSWGYGLTTSFHNHPADITTPQPVPGLSSITQIALGDSHAVALRGDGTVWTWGANGLGQLGYGSMDSQLHTVPQQVPGLTRIVQIDAGQDFSLALRDDGTVWMWGIIVPNNGACDDGSYCFPASGTPGRVDRLSGITQIAAGFWHFVALRNDQTVWGFGYTKFGQAGPATDGEFTPDPFQITGLPSPVFKLAAGFSQSLAIAGPNHQVYEWGDFQLRESPDPDEDFSAESAACGCTVDIKPMGTPGSYIYQPDGTPLAQSGASLVGGLPGPAVDISANYEARGALLSDGSVWTWHPEAYDSGPFQQSTRIADSGGVASTDLTQLVLAPVDWGFQDCHTILYTGGCTVVRPLAIGRPTLTVPYVVGRPAADAMTTIQQAGLAVTTSYTTSCDVNPGQVDSTSPQGGDWVTLGSTVDLVISTGKPKNACP